VAGTRLRSKLFGVAQAAYAGIIGLKRKMGSSHNPVQAIHTHGADMPVIPQLNPNQNINPVANFNKPENIVDTVYYGKYQISGGAVPPVASLSAISALLDEMLAAIPQPVPADIPKKVQYAKAWITYMGPKGGLVQSMAQAVTAILTAATSD
jgi:hypothetical protein